MDFETLTQYLEEARYGALIGALNEMNAVDAAEFLGCIDGSQLPRIFRMLKKDISADIFAELDFQSQEQILMSITDREASSILNELFIDDAVNTLEELPASMVSRILQHTSPEMRNEINRFLNYPDSSAGSIMTSEFCSIHSHMTVEEAVARIRKTGRDKETVYTIYVTDSKRILQGTVGLRDLLFSPPDTRISSLMDTAIISANTLDDQETVAMLISKYHLLALPIVDTEERLVGIVTVDDAITVIEEETTEDMETMAAILPSDKPYLQIGVLETWKKRIPWLLILLLSAFFTTGIISHYEDALSRMVALTAFIPLLMGTGGNAGGQASVTIIRSLSLGDIRPVNIFQVLWKEFRVSLLCAVTLSFIIFAKTMWLDQEGFAVSMVVTIALFAAVIIAKLVGSLLPIATKVVGLDPAVIASPFVTTIVDTVSLLIYFGIATVILDL